MTFALAPVETAPPLSGAANLEHEIGRLAARHVRGARNAGPSATSLVHEAFLRLNRREKLPYADRTHFFAVASRAMRQIVIPHRQSRRVWLVPPRRHGARRPGDG